LPGSCCKAGINGSQELRTDREKSDDPRMRIGFVLNHYETHQVPHVAPTAFALSRLRPEWHIEIMCSTAAEAHFAADIAVHYPGKRVLISRLRVQLYARTIDPLVSQVSFRRKRAVQRANTSLSRASTRWWSPS
jgi:hypothetical protein